MHDSVIVIEERNNSSTDYYIIPFLEKKGYIFKRYNFDEILKVKPDGRLKLIIVRYLNSAVLHWIEKNSKRIEKIYYFIDDDILDIRVAKYIPFKYAWKIFNKAYKFRKWILKNTNLIVSNEYLKEKYSAYAPFVIHPYPIHIDMLSFSAAASSTPVVFYHATASHKQEFLWLKDLMKSIDNENMIFEVVVDKKIAKLYRNINNVILINPMNWQEYLKFSLLKYRNIGLALLFDNLFNRARGYIKLFNIIRSGAVGIYSEIFPCAHLIKEFSAGVVIPMNVNIWKEAILELSKNEKERLILFENSKKLVQYMKEKAEEGYNEIFL